MKGFWKDKQTGIVAEVISATSDAVWYQIPEWRGPQNCSREVFEKAMERMPEILNQSTMQPIRPRHECSN